MKIVIVGAGISGCAAYLSLQKHLPQSAGDTHSYKIYEAYDTLRDTTFRERADAASGEESTRSATLVVGGGLGIGPNGLNVLKRLDESLFRDAVRSGYPYSNFKIKSAYGWTLMDVAATADVNGQTMNSVAMSRHSIWKALRDRVPDDVIVNKKVARVIPRGSSSGKHLIEFTDGSESVEADLVLGADGLKSTVKCALFDAEAGGQDPYPPQYEGLTGVGGFHTVTESLRKHIPKGTMTITFGGNGFFGYMYSSSAVTDDHRDSPSHLPTPGDTITWWSTYGIDECPDPKAVDKAAINQDLRTRHAHWKDPVIQEIIASVEVETMWPTWTTPDLPVWYKDGIVLLGDAAHALPPTSGQGSGQALEDVESFSLFLSHYLKKAYQDGQVESSEKEAIQLAAKNHMALREPHVKAILDEARQRQQSKKNMNIVQEFMMYLILYLVGCFASANPAKAVLEYNVADEVRKVLSEEETNESVA
ncbi:uncharacterized protein N7469_000835 [Penicillium citrinum]|uniref:FAD-binding domain-containing protein n=2 Tax=Penicillium TaxID=5073 RepID=A0A9W9PDR9_PENCI|nr:uncharacterized protein N7469_000835 [Penicillium citrinum]KAJ5242508.1 hypothetical protein N7469_000835 [Penicillium citrinum]KAJ5599990.1 hypothetical protein N7450_001057 [Penicillium hetheringtonii]